MNSIPLFHQAGALRSYFPTSTIIRKGETELTWIGKITPSPLSPTYKIKLRHKVGEPVKIFVIGQKLKLAEGKDELPHVYSTERQHLCLHFPKNREWNPGMFYVQSLIPWASEWLYHYELWLGSGEWRGGGIDHDGETK